MRTGFSAILPSTRAAVAGLLLAVARGRGAEGAELPEARPISPAGSRAAQVQMTLDAVDNAFLALVLDRKVRVITLGSALSAESPLSDINIPEESPAIESGPRGVTFAAFAREDNELGATGREIFLSGNQGGSFGPPRNVSLNMVDDHSPRLALDRAGAPRLAWSQGSGEEAWILHYDPASGLAAAPVARGERPAIAIDLQGRSHLAFTRGESVLVADQGPEGFGSGVEVDQSGEEGDSPLLLGVDAGGRLALLHRVEAGLRLSVRDGEAFGAPRLLDSGLDPLPAGLDFRLDDGGRLVASYLKGGEVFVIRGDLQGALEPEMITLGARAEAGPALREDSRGNIHLGFVRDGRAHYTNSATPPMADFSVSSLEGELPFQVGFTDLSTGEVRVWRWSFGDGAISPELSPTHVYRSVGRFTVRLEAFGPGGESSMERSALITVLPPSNTMRVADVAAFPGMAEVWAPVIGYHREAIQGFQVAGGFDPGVLFLRELSLYSTLSATYQPEFFAPRISNHEGHFTCGLIFDYEEPSDGRTMPAGANQRLIFLVLDVLPSAPPGDSLIELSEAIGPSGLGCMYAAEGLSRLPVLTPGTVRVMPAATPPPRLFLRGDPDLNGEVNLTDAVLILRTLFQGGEPLPCADGGDSNDSGEVDLSDAIPELLT